MCFVPGQPPTLDNYDLNDWPSFYYDRTDVHSLKFTSVYEAGTFYIGVTNHKDKASAPLTARLTLQINDMNAGRPCLLNCSGRGDCDDMGRCTCDADSAGDYCQSDVSAATMGVPRR